MKERSKRILLVNACGTLGYIFCLLLWGWTGIVFLPMILANERIEQLLLPAPSEQPIAPAPVGEASPVMMVVALVITAVILLATVIMLLRAPIAIARAGKSMTTKAASSAVPLITRHQPLPVAKQRHLTVRLIKLAKLLLVLLPVAISFVGAFVELPLPFEVVQFTASVLALIALGWFTMQYGLARLLGVTARQLV